MATKPLLSMTDFEKAELIRKLEEPMPLSQLDQSLEIARQDCDEAQAEFERIKCGGIKADELPMYPTMPPPLTDWQTFQQVCMNPLSLKLRGIQHYVAFSGQWFYTRYEDLTNHFDRFKL